MIRGGAARDHIYGDSGFNLRYDVEIIGGRYIVARDLTVAVNGTAAQPITADSLVPGSDIVRGESGSDILFGDHGIVRQTPGILRILTPDYVVSAETLRPDAGAETSSKVAMVMMWPLVDLAMMKCQEAKVLMCCWATMDLQTTPRRN